MLWVLVRSASSRHFWVPKRYFLWRNKKNSSEMGSTLKGKFCCSLRSTLFPFEVDPFSEGAWVSECKQDVTKVVFLGKTDVRNLPSVSSFLTLKMPRKPSSENVVCLCRLLNILATFQACFFFCIQANSVAPDQTAPRRAVWSGSTLFAKMTFKITSRWQSRRQLLWLAV